MERENGTLVIEERKRLTLGGVKSVDSFTDSKITLTAGAGRVTITGERLRITCFSETTGAFALEGLVSSVAFKSAKTSFIAGLLK